MSSETAQSLGEMAAIRGEEVTAYDMIYVEKPDGSFGRVFVGDLLAANRVVHHISATQAGTKQNITGISGSQTERYEILLRRYIKYDKQRERLVLTRIAMRGELSPFDPVQNIGFRLGAGQPLTSNPLTGWNVQAYRGLDESFGLSTAVPLTLNIDAYADGAYVYLIAYNRTPETREIRDFALEATVMVVPS